MNWTNVRLIFSREVRDQLRDRRTLFMIAVLPLLLYPLLGMSFLQISQFMRTHATKVLLIGLPETEGLPKLVDGDRFAESLFVQPERAKLMHIDTLPASAVRDPAKKGEELTHSGKYEVVVYFPAEFGAALTNLRNQLQEHPTDSAKLPKVKVPDPVIVCDSRKEKSHLAVIRVNEVLQSWREAIGKQNLTQSRISAEAVKPFNIATEDVAEPDDRKSALWSKVLPFVLLLWALTGAFYPAVDLCAGEKERGTLETLLSSPAERTEIVWGKLLTIMLFSIATAVLNLLSMGLTGSFVMQAIPNFGPPPPLAILWLLVALVPVSALYSALCLALAAFARSTKEGQYYLMPLVLITMPLTILPMSPGVELNVGNALVPITGLVLLLRTLLEGNLMGALPYAPIVICVTLGCCLLAIRWAADQFNAESVLFRESERFDLQLWLRHLMRDREATPTVPIAFACGVLILMVQFFMNFAMPKGQNLVVIAAISQLVVVATPALLMTVMFTRSPRKTLLLNLSPAALMAIPVMVVLAVCIHPLALVLQSVVLKLYPLSEEVQQQIAKLFGDVKTPTLIWIIAIVPAICEELAFRGFILSGLRHMGHKWRAIVISSIFFGLTHGVFQQSLIASLLGCLIGYIAIQTGSIFPCMVFHALHNSLQLLASKITVQTVEGVPVLQWLINIDALRRRTESESAEFVYRWPVLAFAVSGTILVLYWLHKLPYVRSQEERLQERIEELDAPGVELSSAATGS